MKVYGYLRKRMYVVSFTAGICVMGLIFLFICGIMPVGKADGKTIYQYQLNNYRKYSEDNTIKNIGKDMIFDKAMNELGVSITKEEVEAEYLKMVEEYGGIKEFESILIDTTSNPVKIQSSIRQGLLRDKAIAKYQEEGLTYEEGSEKLNEYLEKYQASRTIIVY